VNRLTVHADARSTSIELIHDFARQGAAGYQEHPIFSRRLG
jgi:hypothetical protein